MAATCSRCACSDKSRRWSAASAATPWRDALRRHVEIGTRALSADAEVEPELQLLPTIEKQEIRVKFARRARRTPYAARCTDNMDCPKGLHNSFHLWQDINQGEQRATSSVVLLGGRRQAAPSTLRVIYDFVNSLSVFYFLSLWAACKTSLLPKSFVFPSAELLRNRTWDEQQQRQLCNKCG